MASPAPLPPTTAKPLAGAAKGRVLRATFGCNPNSSSLGVDVTFLIFGATFASALALGLGALLRRSQPPEKPPTGPVGAP